MIYRRSLPTPISLNSSFVWLIAIEKLRHSLRNCRWNYEKARRSNFIRKSAKGNNGKQSGYQRTGHTNYLFWLSSWGRWWTVGRMKEWRKSSESGCPRSKWDAISRNSSCNVLTGRLFSTWRNKTLKLKQSELYLKGIPFLPWGKNCDAILRKHANRQIWYNRWFHIDSSDRSLFYVQTSSFQPKHASWSFPWTLPNIIDSIPNLNSTSFTASSPLTWVSKSTVSATSKL